MYIVHGGTYLLYRFFYEPKAKFLDIIGTKVLEYSRIE